MREGSPAGRPAATEASAAARERQSFVRHELRAPLAVLYPTLSLLLEGGAGELTPTQRRFLETLDRNVVRLEALLAGVAESGWADCSAAPVLPAEVALRDVVEEVVMPLRDDASGVPITIDAGPRPTPLAWADPDDVRQAVAALVRNAAAYTPAAGAVTVRIGAGDTPGTVVVEVADTGPGIPPEELPRAFDFGFRGELARRSRTPGLGAGLWVCRELAARNGGSVALSSDLGGGTTAMLTLPAAGNELP